MNPKILLIIGLILLSVVAYGQPSESTTLIKQVSVKDKTVIIDIFKTLTQDRYYLEFSNGDVYGKFVIPSVQRTSIKNGESFPMQIQYILGWYKEIGLLYVINKTQTAVDLETALGKAAAGRLTAVINKYTAGQGD